ncbi:hypothetical protein ACSX02_12380, partial [Staphylococcus epidermidis]|uniref:hypothetical protein n=1 Tax=Staphylococcus epidermidis TaxID=1282 RepID=UPI003EE75ABF
MKRLLFLLVLIAISTNVAYSLQSGMGKSRILSLPEGGSIRKWEDSSSTVFVKTMPGGWVWITVTQPQRGSARYSGSITN